MELPAVALPLEQQEEIDWIQVAQQRTDVAQQLEQKRAELDELRKTMHQRMQPFYAARQQYFNYLYRRDYDAWFVLDPVITVHPDEIFFECFSQDESSYGRLGAGFEVFKNVGEFACGTTNIDYSDALYGEFQKLRDYKTDDNVLILKADMRAGHSGKTGRFQSLEDDALYYSFFLDLEGISE